MQVYDSDILGTKNMDFESVPWKNGLFFIFFKVEFNLPLKSMFWMISGTFK